MLDQLGFVIEKIELRGTTVHKQVNHALGTRHSVQFAKNSTRWRYTAGDRLGRSCRTPQRSQRRRAQAERVPGKKVPAGEACRDVVNWWRNWHENQVGELRSDMVAKSNAGVRRNRSASAPAGAT